MDMMTHLVAMLSFIAQLIITAATQVCPEITLNGKMKMGIPCVVVNKIKYNKPIKQDSDSWLGSASLHILTNYYSSLKAALGN